MAGCSQIYNTVHELKPTLIMIMVQTIFAVVNIGYKLCANYGMNLSVLIAYRFMFGAAFIVPLAILVERKKRPRLTKTIVFYGFLCGLFGGSLGQNLYLRGLALTSATFASAMTNLMPAITFVIATGLRLEKLGWNTAAGKAKVFGTLMGIGGAMLLTFYKGPALNIWNTNINLLETTKDHHHSSAQSAQNQLHGHNLLVGALLALASCVCYSIWLIFQAKVAEFYPCPYSITAMMVMWASIQGVAFALCVERDWSQWILGWDIRLLTAAVAGILGSGLMFTLVAWCVSMRGPLFVSVFNPLMLVLVAIAGSLFLEEKLHLGMLLGAILIVIGLYAVLWGKGKELKKVSQLMPENQDTQVEIAIPPHPPLHNDDSSHGGSSIKGVEDERGEEKRDSQSSSEVLGGLYLYP